MNRNWLFFIKIKILKQKFISFVSLLNLLEDIKHLGLRTDIIVNCFSNKKHQVINFKHESFNASLWT